MPLPRSLFLFLAFGCIGFTNEIFFTAIYDNIEAVMDGKIFNWSLTGTSYVWMFPIYGLAGILYPIGYKHIARFHVLLRLCVYGLSMLGIEFVAGFILQATTGHCPWYYTHGWHVMHLIRLDYFPLWAVFGYVIERIYLYLDDIYTRAHTAYE